jgi:hypothetical protein
MRERRDMVVDKIVAADDLMSRCCPDAIQSGQFVKGSFGWNLQEKLAQEFLKTNRAVDQRSS